ncbi:AAA family ATPase [Peribacillus sp. NPDC101481]|uniref:AAA family ATPase n=1 Tax=unclassified Peribacillus TaxID=2675266 RepID=UPI00381BBE62
MIRGFVVSDGRKFTEEEKQMIWKKSPSHQESVEELRVADTINRNWHNGELRVINVLLEGDAGSGKTQLAKALSHDLRLPYTKITCFADMDKSDIFGSLLPVMEEAQVEDKKIIQFFENNSTAQQFLENLSSYLQLNMAETKEYLAKLEKKIKDTGKNVTYKYYPSEIVRALHEGYLLEIQEPTVIRDASVLVALNSALEIDGILNTPTGMIKRHHDAVVVITTNRNYQGNRPLNESLRDRVQHTERMNLPSKGVMVNRALSKVGFADEELLAMMAEIIILLDATSKANGIKGVAGMRSYFYWVNAVHQGENIFDSIYQKVIYKITTDETEIRILEKELESSQLLERIQSYLLNQKNPMNKPQAPPGSPMVDNYEEQQDGEEELQKDTSSIYFTKEEEKIQNSDSALPQQEKGEPLEIFSEKRSKDIEIDSNKGKEHEESQTGISQQQVKQLPEILEKQEADKKKELNKEARTLMKNTIHQKEGIIIHRPHATKESMSEAEHIKKEITPLVESMARKILAVLEKKESVTYTPGKLYGTRFNASKVAMGDYRYFDKKNPPTENPSLAIAIRIDESGSMVRAQRMESAKKAIIALTEFCRMLNVPLMIYGDTADISQREMTSLYSYKEFDDGYDGAIGKIATMKPRQNNRDGVNLRILADKLSKQIASTKLLINISDGQPKAMPNYSGDAARVDIQSVIREYERKDVLFLSVAIGEDKEKIAELHGRERFLDMTDLKSFPQKLVETISRFL